MLIVRHPEDLLLDALGQLVPKRHDELRTGQVGVFLHIFRHVDRLADIDGEIVPQMEIVAVLQAHRHDIDRLLIAEIIIGPQGNTEDAFAERQEGVLGLMPSLR